MLAAAAVLSFIFSHAKLVIPLAFLGEAQKCHNLSIMSHTYVTSEPLFHYLYVRILGDLTFIGALGCSLRVVGLALIQSLFLHWEKERNDIKIQVLAPLSL